MRSVRDGASWLLCTNQIESYFCLLVCAQSHMRRMRQIFGQDLAIPIFDSVKPIKCKDVVSAWRKTLDVKRSGAIYEERTRRSAALVFIYHEYLRDIPIPDLHRT